MKTPTKFVSELSDTEREELQQVMKTGTEPARRRAHAVMLNARAYSVDQIADIYEVDRDTVSQWLARWENGGGTNLDDQAGRGRLPILNEKEQKQAIQLVDKDPRSTQQALAKIEKKTGKKISRDTLKRLLKKGGKVWKRVRRSLRGKRDETDFRAVEAELTGLRAQAAADECDLYYFDEAGFTLDPCVSYAWQNKGETLELPAAASVRINVLGFYNTDNDLHPYVFEHSVDSEIVIACFDAFCRTRTQLTLVVMDGASIHTSAAFQAKLPAWEAQGVIVYLLSAYSPELNLIEILWRMMKYRWLPLWAYQSYNHLLRAIIEVLKGVGSKYQINFAQ